MSRCRTWSLPALVAFVVICSAAVPVKAQIPDEFKNLQVLPKDISKGELVQMMRSFAGGLGVRCTHCHVGGSEHSLQGMDFASDEKKEKRVARAMITMVREINGKLIPAAGIDNPLEVKCATCHHGLNRPQSIADVTMHDFEKEGIDAAKANYLALKEKYYGSDSYDFKPGPLNTVAEWLSEEKNDAEAAIDIMQFNIEQNPDVGSSYTLLGRIQAGAGKKQEAIASFKKALEIDPEDKYTARLLQRLESN